MILPWELLSEELAYNGYRKVLRRKYRLPTGIEASFDIKKEGSPVCVLALTEDQQVILARQFRPGPGEVLLELPGGGIEASESPEQAIKRELLEETGYLAGEIAYVTQSLECAYSTVRRHCFVATGCKKIAEPKTDAHEFTETVLLSLKDFRAHLQSGMLTDIDVGYLGLDYLGLLAN